MIVYISPRIWGRDKNGNWTVVTPDENGNAERVYLTNLLQCLLLSVGESPFWANLGIPAQQSVVQQVFPDYYVNQIQQWFARFFPALSVAREDAEQPTYRVIATLSNGQVSQESIIR